jgi:outer membrane biosynthesis protein TonB
MATKKNKKKSKTKPKKVLKKKPAPKKKAPAKKAAPKSKKKPAPKKSRARGKSQNTSPIAFDRAGLGSGAAGQSGSLQGLSNRAGADSESVDELLEEGNAFEAEVVEGVEDAPDANHGEVRTRELPEDDVPDEYLDQDK